MSDTNKRTCGGCRFAVQASALMGGSGALLCHLKPPAAVPMPDRLGNLSVLPVRPPVSRDDTGCVEWAAVLVS